MSECDTFLEIAVDDGIYAITKELYDNMNKFNYIQKLLMKMMNVLAENDIYEGRGKQEMALFMKQYTTNVIKLMNYYSYAYSYAMETYMTMLEFDTELRKKFENSYTAIADKQ